MATAADVVAMAASQIGITEVPSGSNKTKYGAWYGMDGEPWCDMFVSWCGDQVGAGEVTGKFAYCPYHVNWFKQRGQWLDREEKPQPGDIIFFANKGLACHVGIVERRNGSSSVTTIEGNTSVSSNDNGGAVMRRERTYGNVGSNWYILGFGRPDYASTQPQGPTAEEIAAAMEAERVEKLPEALKKFTDLWPGRWYTDPVNTVVVKKIMNGTSATTWGPDAPLTRAQALAVISRVMNADLDILPFNDIAPWYAEAILWAANNGIIDTNSDNARPNDPCTRAELVTFLWRAAGKPVPKIKLEGLSGWQTDSCSWAIEKGILSNPNAIRPNDICTRAEAAAITARYLA